MSTRSLGISDELRSYLLDHLPREHPVLARLRHETAALGPISRMQIAREQGPFLDVVARMVGARRALEIGTFTGYSATVLALAGASVVTCDISDEHTKIARRAWVDAGVADRIDLRLAPALETLTDLAARGERFDLAFIDADKANYEAYWDRCVELVRPGGAILVDNVLWSGRVIDPSVDDEDTRAIRRLNGKIRDDVRVAMAMLGTFDGLTVAVVLPPGSSSVDGKGTSRAHSRFPR